MWFTNMWTVGGVKDAVKQRERETVRESISRERERIKGGGEIGCEKVFPVGAKICRFLQ